MKRADVEIRKLPATFCWNEELHRSKFPHASPLIQHDFAGRSTVIRGAQ
jgi:hypothetical protein